jgi:hypothetical protein
MSSVCPSVNNYLIKLSKISFKKPGNFQKIGKTDPLFTHDSKDPSEAGVSARVVKIENSAKQLFSANRRMSHKN